MRLVDRTYELCTQPQQPYFELLDRIHQHLVPRTYVEIGVSTARSLTMALPGTECIGIDPEPKPAFPLGRHTRVFAMTSDDFFAQHDLARAFDGVPLDLAFIDGMHHFEYALRDFINLEKASNPDTTILIHDCLPNDEEHAARERVSHRWAGDVWRLIVLLRAWRPDLDVAVADPAPSGLGVVRGLDPTSTVLSDHYDEIVAHYLEMPYSALDDGAMAEHLNQIFGDWPTVRALLPRQPFRSVNLDALKAERALLAVGPAAARALRRTGRQLSSRGPGRTPAMSTDPVGSS